MKLKITVEGFDIKRTEQSIRVLANDVEIVTAYDMRFESGDAGKCRELLAAMHKVGLIELEANDAAKKTWSSLLADVAPHWQPLDDTESVISQISDMHAGVVEENERLRLALGQIANDPANAVTYFEDKWRGIAKQALSPNEKAQIRGN